MLNFDIWRSPLVDKLYVEVSKCQHLQSTGEKKKENQPKHKHYKSKHTMRKGRKKSTIAVQTKKNEKKNENHPMHIHYKSTHAMMKCRKKSTIAVQTKKNEKKKKKKKRKSTKAQTL